MQYKTYDHIIPLTFPADMWDTPRLHLRSWRDRLFSWPWTPWKKYRPGVSMRQRVDNIRAMVDECAGITDVALGSHVFSVDPAAKDQSRSFLSRGTAKRIN